MTEKEFADKFSGCPLDLEELAESALKCNDGRLKDKALDYLNTMENFMGYLAEDVIDSEGKPWEFG